MSIESNALLDITSGVYILSGEKNGKKFGRIVDAVIQQNFNPAILTISLMKTGYSVSQIDINDKVGISTLSKKLNSKLLYTFGYNCSELINKFDKVEYITTDNNIPIVIQDTVSYMECEVEKKEELDDHIIIYLKVVSAKKISDQEPLTYAYYYNNLKDKIMNNSNSTNIKGDKKMLKLDFYLCPICKNLVEVIDKGIATISCCGREMIKLEPNTTDASHEKHLPVVHFEDDVASIFIGETEHPMENTHYIQKICVVTEDGTLYRKEFKAIDKPEFVVDIGDSKKIEVYAYCNQHGLWKTVAER